MRGSWGRAAGCRGGGFGVARSLDGSAAKGGREGKRGRSEIPAAAPGESMGPGRGCIGGFGEEAKGLGGENETEGGIAHIPSSPGVM